VGFWVRTRASEPWKSIPFMDAYFAVAVLSLVQFLKINISQGSVATRFGCNGISKIVLLQIFQRVWQ